MLNWSSCIRSEFFRLSSRTTDIQFSNPKGHVPHAIIEFFDSTNVVDHLEFEPAVHLLDSTGEAFVRVDSTTIKSQLMVSWKWLSLRILASRRYRDCSIPRLIHP